ncbi:toll/interleukin-1 receptor domain-containing protein [Acidicapsa acidisoli]|uniref:toll/interleukin-1 receptor domain-containing protein n=1 Tax=Acidicapsa acidisoli TaxID=1615681 RepID=UPI0021DFED9A|nr:toll/interleukin-1 receptor domain-containing protein [Acidicapsa acidisoli]
MPVAVKKQRGIFISHSHADKRFARRIGADLKEAGFRVWIDEAEIMLGDSLLEKISEGIDRMDYVAAIISPDSVKSRWVKYELRKAMTQEIENRKVKVLPLVIGNCKLPSFLADKAYADFRDPKAYKNGLQQVIRRLSVRPSRKKVEDTFAAMPVPSAPVQVPSISVTPVSAAPQVVEKRPTIDLRTFEYKKEATDIGVGPDELMSLPKNALFLLLIRCWQRLDELLMPSWFDGNYMHDTMNPMRIEIRPGFDEILNAPKTYRRKAILDRAIQIMSNGLSVVTRLPHRVRCPSILIDCLGTMIAVIEYGRGEEDAAYKAFYGTFRLYAVLNEYDNSIVRSELLKDFQDLRKEALEHKWADDTPIDRNKLWHGLWRAGLPKLFRSDLFQKVSFLTSFHKF